MSAQINSFVGRQQAIRDIRHLLVHSRMLTLTGVGGIGKTRLALAVAERVLPDFPDGVWLVDLAPIADGAGVTHALAAALGVRESASNLIDHLVNVLRPKALLALLDNCEHVADACAELSEGLLRGCPGVQVVATSREPLQVVGEVVWRVPGLAVPDPAQAQNIRALYEIDGVRLFAERAAAANPGFHLDDRNAAAVIDICRELDGIPLAIELAAARTNVLTPAQVAERLVNRFHLLTVGGRTTPKRQRTLHATLDWSYELLSEPEQRLFERLSVFAGGWTLQAAEMVCTDLAVR